MEMKYFFLGVLFTVLMIIVSLFAFQLGKKTNELNPENDNINKASSPAIISPSPESAFDSAQLEDAIIESILNKNFDYLSGYTDSPLQLKINTIVSEYTDPVEVLEKLSVINSSEGKWSFDQDSEPVKSLAASYPEDYSDAFVAVSSDYYCVSFQFSGAGLINKIVIHDSYKKLLQ